MSCSLCREQVEEPCHIVVKHSKIIMLSLQRAGGKTLLQHGQAFKKCYSHCREQVEKPCHYVVRHSKNVLFSSKEQVEKHCHYVVRHSKNILLSLQKVSGKVMPLRGHAIKNARLSLQRVGGKALPLCAQTLKKCPTLLVESRWKSPTITQQVIKKSCHFMVRRVKSCSSPKGVGKKLKNVLCIQREQTTLHRSPKHSASSLSKPPKSNSTWKRCRSCVLHKMLVDH